MGDEGRVASADQPELLKLQPGGFVNGIRIVGPDGLAWLDRGRAPMQEQLPA